MSDSTMKIKWGYLMAKRRSGATGRSGMGWNFVSLTFNAPVKNREMKNWNPRKWVATKSVMNDNQKNYGAVKSDVGVRGKEKG